MKRIGLVFVALAALFLSPVNVSAQDAQDNRVTMKIWPDGAPNSSGPNARDAGFEPILVIYKAQEPNGLAVLGLPGGGYAMLSKSHEAHDFYKFYNSIGVTYAVLEYRLPNEHSEIPLSDVQKAMTILRGMSEELGFTKLGIQGCSAGGHLASTAATHYTSPENRPDFQILFYPVITMDKSFTHISSHDLLLGQDASEELEVKFSNEKQVTSDTPPAIIFHSTDDRLVPVENSIRYYQALVANRVSASMHLYPRGSHGWGAGDNFAYKAQWTSELEAWLNNEILRPQGQGGFGGFPGGFGGFGGGFPGGGFPGGGAPAGAPAQR
ncbi:MAG: alpha/beta hydrolase [Bacteroidaceae bacterium]|nr:alpha/beta hydrolase [Bacteroidaceae bacterium]